MMLWLASLAAAQGLLQDDLEDCVPRVIGGTPGVRITQQASETNAQIYGAVALAESALVGADALPAAFRMSALYGVNRLPTVAACRYEQQYGMASMDMFSSASGLSIPIPIGDDGLLRLFYAGSISGTLMHFPSRQWANNPVLSTEAMALAGVGMGYAPFVAPLVDRTSGPQTLAADAVVGAQFFNPWDKELGALGVGYVLSTGLYTNVSVDKVKVLASALVTQELSELAMAKLGFSGIVVAEALGQSHAFARRKLIQPPPAAATTRGLAPALPQVDLQTLHLEQRDIGGWVDVAVTGGVRPDVFLHEGWLGVHDPAHLGVVRLGVTELPAMPWYDVEGGQKFYFDVRAFLGVVRITRNDAETLTNFPYAQDAIHFQLGVSDELARTFAEALRNR